MKRESYELSAEGVRDLLYALHLRLEQRGLAAAIFVVGGAAIAVTGIRDPSRRASSNRPTRPVCA